MSSQRGGIARRKPGKPFDERSAWIFVRGDTRREIRESEKIRKKKKTLLRVTTGQDGI